jgi:hypothetical protein
MKRIAPLLAASFAVTLLVSGCGMSNSNSDSLEPFDLTDSALVNALCGDEAGDVYTFVTSMREANPNAVKRTQLTDWDIEDPTDDEYLDTLLVTLEERASVECESEEETVEDLEDRLTLDESLWGDLSWEYPQEYADLAREYGYDTQELSGEEFPVFVIGSTLPGKHDTDSVRPALAEKSADQVYAITISEPDVGFQICSGLAHSRIEGGKALIELNPWLEECADPAFINDWAEAAKSGTKAEQLIAAKKLVVVAMLMERIGSTDTSTDSTAFNFHLVWQENGGTLSVNPKNLDAIPEFELNPAQYTGEFVMFEVTLKGQQGCWLRIGINTGDGRFAGFNCGTDEPPGEPGCAEPCGTTPPCVTCVDDRKGTEVPAETDPDGTVESPAPAPTTPAAPPDPVDTDPVDEIDTNTDLEPEGESDGNTVEVGD